MHRAFDNTCESSCDGRRPGASARDLGRALDGEDGMVTWVTLVAVIFFLLMVALVSNAAITINQKMATQNAADATAHAGALLMARGLNAVSAANHMLGELTALFVLHHAVGGKYLDEHYRDRRENNSGEMALVNTLLGISWAWAQIAFEVRPEREAYNQIKHTPVADERSTLYQAWVRLKWIAVGAYFTHGSGQIVALIPWTRAAGLAMMWGAYFTELKLAQEALVLKAFEQIALALAPIKLHVIPLVLRGVWAYEQAAIRLVPLAASRAAQALASAHSTVGVLTHNELPVNLLPVAQETTSLETRSQLMRASYPWVNYWRAPIVNGLRWTCTLCGAGDYYLKWTNTYSREMCTAFRSNRSSSDGYGGYGLRLYTLRDLVVSGTKDKGDEPWVHLSGSPRADYLFCVMGFSRQPEPPPIVSAPFFRQGNPQGVVAMAQAMVYNGNPQQAPGVRSGRMQPTVGWDTLAWRSGAVEYSTTSTSPSRPVVKLNWQAKLVPISQTKLALTQGALISDEQIAHVFRVRLQPRFGLGKSLYTH